MGKEPIIFESLEKKAYGSISIPLCFRQQINENTMFIDWEIKIFHKSNPWSLTLI
ncbi:hypothetical protein [Bartonella sp. HY038]|uniref:hypothetical protein n=1 Tax=Bartonella sp. HY038 TaxID=2759660 RepID=UPI0015F797E8|nr:hypothetical protein [Bartonella sp. HY038]